MFIPNPALPYQYQMLMVNAKNNLGINFTLPFGHCSCEKEWPANRGIRSINDSMVCFAMQFGTSVLLEALLSSSDLTIVRQ